MVRAWPAGATEKLSSLVAYHDFGCIAWTWRHRDVTRGRRQEKTSLKAHTYAVLACVRHPFHYGSLWAAYVCASVCVSHCDMWEKSHSALSLVIRQLNLSSHIHYYIDPHAHICTKFSKQVFVYIRLIKLTSNDSSIFSPSFHIWLSLCFMRIISRTFIRSKSFIELTAGTVMKSVILSFFLVFGKIWTWARCISVCTLIVEKDFLFYAVNIYVFLFQLKHALCR